MTPTPNTPNAKALQTLREKIKTRMIRLEYNDPKERQYGFSYQQYETMLAALTAPIEQVGEWECFCDEAYYHQWAVRNKNGDRGFTSSIHVRTKDEAEFLVSRLNAQGRTQSAVTDCTCEKYKYPWNVKCAHCISAAPPVTAPIEKVDGLAEAVAMPYCEAAQYYELYSGSEENQHLYVKARNSLQAVWQAARLQLQRQGD